MYVCVCVCARARMHAYTICFSTVVMIRMLEALCREEQNQI